MPEAITVSHYMPPDHGSHKDFIAPWARAVETASGGRLRVEIHDGTTPFGVLENQYAQVASGAVDVAHSPGHLPAGRFPLTGIVGLPFLCDDAGQGSALLWDLLPHGLRAEFNGFEVLGLHGDCGGTLHTRDRPIERLSDLAGLRIRVPNPSVAAAIAALGAEPVRLAPLEITPALGAGRIDGAAMPWDVVEYTGAIEHLRFHLDVRLYLAPLYFVMGGAAWMRLTPVDQSAVGSVSGPALTPKFGPWWQTWEASGVTAARDRGHPITVLEPSELARWRGRVAPAIERRIAEIAAETGAPIEPLYRKALSLLGR